MRDEEKCCNESSGPVAMAAGPRGVRERTPPFVPLFVIRKRDQEQYWCCSSEHGSGWSDGTPKQSFSPSELATQIGLLAREFWNDVTIIRLICS